MRLNVDLSLTTVQRSGVLGWRPRRLFGPGSSGALFLPGMPGTLFRDVAGTLPVSNPGQAVALMRDLSGAGRHAVQATTAHRPVFGRHPASGIRNRLPNNRMDGAVVGPIGGGGALPDGWSVGGGMNVSEVLEVGTRGGHPYIRVAATADNSGGGAAIFPRLRFSGTSSIPYETNSVWTGSAFIASVSESHTSGLIMVVNVAGNLQATSVTNEFGRRAISGSTSNLGATHIRLEIGPSVPAGEVFTAIYEIAALQLEPATVASAVQITGANGFDVAEAGQRSVSYIAPDGVDDWMEFASAFQPAGGYTAGAVFWRGMNARHDIFGRGGNADNRFIVTTAGTLVVQNGDSANRRNWNNVFPEKQVSVLVARVPGTGGEKLFYNGIDQGAADQIDGAIFPMNPVGYTSLFRSGAGFFATGRFYGGALVGRAVDDAEGALLSRYLARQGGVAP